MIFKYWRFTTFKIFYFPIFGMCQQFFKTGTFNFKLPKEKRKEVKPYPIAPQLILPEKSFFRDSLFIILAIYAYKESLKLERISGIRSFVENTIW